MKHLSLEMCHQLKAAGYPQERHLGRLDEKSTHFVWIEFNNDALIDTGTRVVCFEYLIEYGYKCNILCVCPTTDELLAPAGAYYTSYTGKRWIVSSILQGITNDYGASEESLVEAAAYFWIAMYGKET